MNEQAIINRYRNKLTRLVLALKRQDISRQAINDHIRGHDDRGELQDTTIDPCLTPLLEAEDAVTLEFDNALSDARNFLGMED